MTKLLVERFCISGDLERMTRTSDGYQNNSATSQLLIIKRMHRKCMRVGNGSWAYKLNVVTSEGNLDQHWSRVYANFFLVDQAFCSHGPTAFVH